MDASQGDGDAGPARPRAQPNRRMVDAQKVEFATIMLFDSLEQVRAFAGEDYETAYVPPRAQAVLARFDQRSAHHDTLLRPRTI
jgi:hypothetical protein